MGPDLPHGAGEHPARSDAAVDAAVAALHRLFLADHSVPSVLQRVVELAAAVLPGVAEASITILQAAGDGATVASSGVMAYELDETQYRSGDGPCLSAAEAGDGPVLLADTAEEVRWPAFVRHARELGAGSVLSVPVELPRSPEERAQHRRRVRAALNLYATTPGAFDDVAVRACQRYTDGAATAVANMRALAASRATVDGLREAIEARLVIEQAKGMVMARLHCTADEAFEVLSRNSQQTRRKLRDLAVDVVAGRAHPS
ncbi:ANTAR domain-containing protein [Klenkia marina]|uniref:ANTAR domain-containing protein n=1 Tax=Klenkia marina TaxID=1960309 RepID=A0A1G4XUI2_9ACTN|nr:GAF and ANTAR domain-containing protein [Klenkia marina]SCX44872.1 ANTAR domain-containing protein [Klenkia marina]